MCPFLRVGRQGPQLSHNRLDGTCPGQIGEKKLKGETTLVIEGKTRKPPTSSLS